MFILQYLFHILLNYFLLLYSPLSYSFVLISSFIFFTCCLLHSFFIFYFTIFIFSSFFNFFPFAPLPFFLLLSFLSAFVLFSSKCTLSFNSSLQFCLIFSHHWIPKCSLRISGGHLSLTTYLCEASFSACTSTNKMLQQT